jgi:hypothetical protein
MMTVGRGGPEKKETLWQVLFSRWYSQLALALVIALSALILRAITVARDVPGSFLPILVKSLLLAGAAAFAGGLLGFLFGIPRTLQTSPPSSMQHPAVREALATNTNLEQISDWLTKIIVGVGLVELRSLGGALDSIARYNAPGLGGDATAAVSFAATVIIFFAVDGFLLIYLWTRIYLTKQFEERMQREEQICLARTSSSAVAPGESLSNSQR